MKPFSTILLMAIILIGAYILYRAKEASNVPKTISLTSAANFKDIQPTICTISDDRDLTGVLYVSHNFARLDLIPEHDKTRATHLIVNDEETGFAWEEGKTVGYKGDYAVLYAALKLGAIVAVQCKPWWIPIGDLLIPPTSVTFQTYQ